MWSWVLVVLACGSSEPESEPEASSPEASSPEAEVDVAAGSAADAAEPPSADGERAGEGLGKVRVEGTIVMEAFEGGVIQIDAVSMIDGQPKVVAVERYPRVGPFRLDVRGAHDSVLLVAYHDHAGDGPSADDPRYEYEGNPLDLSSGDTVSELVFTLATPVDPTLSALAPDDQQPDVEVPGEGGAGPPEGVDPTGNAAPSEAAQAEGSEESG